MPENLCMVPHSQVHGEVTDPDIDIFDREKAFIDAVLIPLIKRLPDLKIVMEHITTADAAQFVESCEGMLRLVLDWLSCMPFLRIFFFSYLCDFVLQDLLQQLSLPNILF